MREGRYWEEEKNRDCVGYMGMSWKRGNKNVWEKCKNWKEKKGESWQEAYRRILRGVGKGKG